MLIRALIVLLVVLNLGTAAWWLSRPNEVAAVPVVQPVGVPRLQLLSEVPKPPVAVVAAPVPASTPSDATPAASPATDPAAAPACFTLGPFADRAASGAAAARLAGQVSRSTPREVPGRAATGYNVSLPPSADRAAAQALAQRIGAAGFDDYLVVATGEQANSIALGRYGSREAAERRQTALKAAGFDARLEAIGAEGTPQWWLDIRAPARTTGLQLRNTSSAAQARSLDCAGLR